VTARRSWLGPLTKPDVVCGGSYCRTLPSVFDAELSCASAINWLMAVAQRLIDQPSHAEKLGAQMIGGLASRHGRAARDADVFHASRQAPRFLRARIVPAPRPRPSGAPQSREDTVSRVVGQPLMSPIRHGTRDPVLGTRTCRAATCNQSACSSAAENGPGSHYLGEGPAVEIVLSGWEKMGVWSGRDVGRERLAPGAADGGQSVKLDFGLLPKSAWLRSGDEGFGDRTGRAGRGG
jgi:hypothetical protein